MDKCLLNLRRGKSERRRQGVLEGLRQRSISAVRSEDGWVEESCERLNQVFVHCFPTSHLQNEPQNRSATPPPIRTRQRG